MFVRNQVCSDHIFYYFLYPLEIPVPNQWSQQLCWAFSMGYGDTSATAAHLQLPQNGPESCWGQSSTVICGRVVWAWGWSWNEFPPTYCVLLERSNSSRFPSFGLFIIFPLFNFPPFHIRVAVWPLESSTGWSNTVLHWELHIYLMTMALLWGKSHCSWLPLTLEWIFSQQILWLTGK